ncbi:MAG TPA: AAA family ATPase [Accumulibacter sp.]|jgi:type II secretory pathway predicted ATPase ExeA|nr:AAA family ATPase [Accumulibacter sp.]HQC81115.1 AAA family ATPase [Accumulibacter sp.]
MMYLDHFGLREAPFRITPHTEFFFDGAKRGATLEALIYAITHDEGIVKVSGEVGSGKTMLCRMLLEKLPANVETVYLANPMLSRDEILLTIAEELRIPLAEGRGQLLLRSLQERLLEIYATGRQVVVLIDEAHAMPPEALEEIRLLSNLESNRHKLLQIVLFGQPELDARLAESGMRQLNDRITHHFTLEPLRRDDIGVYLMFRLRAAGYRGPDLFTGAAIQAITQASQGLTRRINILADKALLAAFSEGAHQIDRRQIKAAIGDARFKRIASGNGQRWRMPIGIVVGLCATAAVAYLAGSRTVGAPQDGSPAATASNAPPAPHVLPAPEPTAAPVEKSASVSPESAPPPTLAERIAATENWLRTVPDGHHVIQLLAADAGSQREVAEFIAGNEKTLDPRALRIHRARLNGRDRLAVIYGDYVSREQASAALAALGAIRRSNNPYVRPVSQLR